MSERIRGLQIDLSMQDMGIGATLAGIRRSFRQLNSDLKLSSNNFKYSEKSMSSYKNRIRELDAATKQQRNNVKELKSQYIQVSKEQGVNSAKAVRLRTEYNKQADTLNRLEHELEETVDGFKKFQKEAQAAARISNSAFGQLGQKFTDLGPKFTSVGESMKNIGRSMSLNVTAPIVAGFGAAVKASVDYESAFAGVRKTVNASEKDYKRLSDGIINMSKKLPVAATEIAEVAESAGQLGIKKKNILGFTKTIIDLGEATNMTREQAATEFARFANIVDMPQKSFSRLGSSVVALGNNMATTESEIMTMSMRIAAQGKLVGMTESDITALSATMSSLGVEAEAGGTAMTTVLKKIDKAVDEGGQSLQAFAEASGLSAREFKAQWEKDPVKALQSFISGLASSKKEGKNLSELLGDLGIKGVREADTILRMANNHELLGEAINISGKAWKENTALSDEANQRYKTMSSKLKVLKNNFIAFGISIGNAIAPFVIKVSDMLTGLFKKMSEMPDGFKVAIAVVGTFAAALGPLILTMGMFTASIGSITTTLGPVMTGIAKAGGVMNFLGTKAPFAAKGLTLVGGAFKFMLGPIGLGIAAVVAIGTAFVVAYKKSETFRNIVHAVIDPVIGAFKNLWNVAKEVFNALKNLFSGNALPTVDLLSKIMPKATAIKVTATLMQIRQTFIDAFNAIWQFGQDIGRKLGQFWNQNGDTIMQALSNIWDTVVNVFTEVKNFLWPILQELGNVIKNVFSNIIVPAIKIGMKVIWTVMKFVWPLVKTLIVDTWNNIKGIVNGALDIILGVVKVFSGIFSGQWGQVWSGVKQIFSGALTFVWNLIQLWLVGKVLGVVKFFGGLFKGAISWAFNGAKSIIGTVLKFIWSVISSVFRNVFSITKSIFTSVFNFIKWVWSSIRNTIVSIVKSLWSHVRNIWNTLYSGTRSVFNRVKSWLINLWNSLRNTVSSVASNLWASVRNTWNRLWSGTRSIFSRVKSMITNVWNSIKRSVTGIASSLWNGVRRTFNNMASGLKSIIGRIKGHIDGMVSKIKSGLNSLIRGLNWVGSKLSLPKIPQLSTGTVHNQVINRKVQTTSDGRMKQDTMAIVGDKGPGNGKGLDGRRELIEYPNGRVALTPAKDTTTIIPKGGRVISGSMRQQMMNAGSLPHFSMGTWFGNAKNWIGGKFRDAGDWLQSKLGDVLDFVGKPGKLLDKLLSSLGIDFGSLTRGMGIVGDITRAAWIKIKEGATSWLKKGLDSAGGDIKGGILDPDKISYFFGHTAAYTAATGRYWHEGVDFPFVYQPVRTPMGGKLIRRPFMSGGYGNWVSVISGAMEMIFAHLRDYSRSPASGSTVKAGDVVGLTGSTGFSTGPHLHYGIKLNGRDVNPEPYLRRAKNSGRIRVGKNGAGGLGRITDTVKTALSQTGLPTTKNFVDFWGKKINEQDGTSLLDISKSVFNTFKVKGHNNYNNTLDNLMAGMRYAKATFGRGLIDKDKQFATGGLIKTPGWYNIAEGGYPEYVIPTDPSKKSAAMKLLALAAQDIKMGKTSNNKRPGQLPNITGGPDDTPLLLQMIQNQQIQIDQQRKQMEVLLEIAAKKLTVDEDSMERVHNRFQDKRERRTNKLNKYRGGAFTT